MHHSYWTIGADQRRFKWTLQWFIETNENFLQNLQVPSVFSNRFNLSLITSSFILLVSFIILSALNIISDWLHLFISVWILTRQEEFF